MKLLDTNMMLYLLSVTIRETDVKLIDIVHAHTRNNVVNNRSMTQPRSYMKPKKPQPCVTADMTRQISLYYHERRAKG